MKGGYGAVDRERPLRAGNGRRMATEEELPLLEPDEGVEQPTGHPAPYGHATEWLPDLARELQAVLNAQRSRRELTGGTKWCNLEKAIRLEPETADLIARGGSVRLGAAQLGMGLLSSSFELPCDMWLRLAESAKAWRLHRCALSAPDHPAVRFTQLVEGLSSLEEHIAALLLLQALSDRLAPCLTRCGVNAKRDDLRIREVFELLHYDEDGLCIDESAGPFAIDGRLAARGILEQDCCVAADGRDPEGVVRPARGFIDDCAGRDLAASAASIPGVELVHPRERLDDVVLSDDQRRVAESLLGSLPWETGQRHPLGILLHGPSGTGKTMLARALAGSSGRPLLLVNGTKVSENDDEHAVVTGLLRRAALDRAFVFIDEADDVIPNGSTASRALLVQLEHSPTVIILATNNPTSFDPALDRRLLVKLELPIPGPAARSTILKRELRIQEHELDDGLIDDPAVERLAESVRMSGGHIKNAVMLASILANHRAGGRGPIGVDDLADALRRQTEDEELFGRDTRLLRWVEQPRPLDAELHDPVMADDLAALVDAFDVIRAERAAAGRHGLGVLLLTTGPETWLVDHAAEALAHGLRLPLAWIRCGSGGVDETDDDDDDFFAGMPASMRPRGIKRRSARRQRSGTSDRGQDDLITEIESELGEQAVVCLRLAGPNQAQAAKALVDRLAVGSHLLLVHQVGGAIPPVVQRRAAATRAWGRPAVQQLEACWRAIGGRGPCPRAEGLAELNAAAMRQRLSQIGIAGLGASCILP